MATRTIQDYSTVSKDENKTLSVREVKKLQARQNRQQMVSQVGGWDSAMVRNAIEQQSIGDFSQTTRLARKMMADAAFSAAINKRVNSLVRSEFFVEPSDQNSPSAKLIAESIESLWYDSVPELVIKNLLTNYLLIGVGLAFVTWKTEDGVWQPIIEVYNTEFLKYDQTHCQWSYRTAEQELVVTPNDGNWILISDWSPGHVKGFVSQLGECWVNKKFGERDWAIGNENHIDSICVVSDTGTGVLQEQSTLDDFAGEIQDKKRDRVITLPAGYSVQFQDAMSSYKPESFSNLIDYCDKKFQISILGGNLSSDVTGGSYSAAQTHHGVELDLTQGDEAVLSTELHNQLLTHVVSVNYGDAIAEEYTPFPRWTTQLEEDLGIVADNLNKVKAFIGDGHEIVNMEDLLVKFGIEIKPKQPAPPTNNEPDIK